MKLIILGLIALIVVGFTMFSLFRPASIPTLQGGGKIESAQAESIRLAKKIYKEKKDQKVEMEASPCLSEDMGNGYALDIAHNPRIPKDDQVKCESVKTGKTKNYIEMTPDGTIIRIE
jgi:hypothetical protein